MYPVQAPEERENKRQNLIKYINTYISDQRLAFRISKDYK